MVLTKELGLKRVKIKNKKRAKVFGTFCTEFSLRTGSFFDLKYLIIFCPC